LIDFAPAFISALSALILGFHLPLKPIRAQSILLRLAGSGVILWIAFEGIITQSHYLRTPPLAYDQWISRNTRSNTAPLLNVGSLSTGSIPIGSVAPDSVPAFHVPWDGIPHNGVGWNKVTGDTASVVILFVDDPQFIQVDVQPPATTPHDQPWVRAKLDRELLPVTSLTRLPEGRIRLQFEVRKPQKKAQPQVLFLAFGPPETLDAPLSGYRLHTVSCK
jgi:hypothetical protein